MRFGIVSLNYNLQDITALARAAEMLDFDGLWIGEVNADPFPALTLASAGTLRLTLGSSVALAFTRSPATLAYLAHDLTRLSHGRFVLGLGTQVRGHIERRFGMAWERPVERLRAYITAIRAIWDTWQTGAKLNVSNDFFTIDLMPPFFSPAPHQYSSTPIYIAGVNKAMLRLGGELADGIVIHAFHTVSYLREIALPAIRAGLDSAGRQRSDIRLSTAVFAIPTDDPAFEAKATADARRQIAFYMSTPAYKVVAEMHGWSEAQYRLSRYVRVGAWAKMDELISDAMMDEMTVRGTWAELPAKIAAKYGDLIDDVSYYLPFVPGEVDDGWKASIAGFKALAKP